MAGHSKFKNIMHRKGAQDAKRAKVFTKLIREITVSARINPDPEGNPRLRSAILAAKNVNMPKDNIDRAIKKASGPSDLDNYEEVRYEGYGPGGIAVIVEGLTDNRNRTAPEVRAAFGKSGGNLGESNSVSFMFDHVGCLTYAASVGTADQVMEAVIDAGGEDVESNADHHLVYTSMEDLYHTRDQLHAKFGDPAECKLIWKPKTSAPISDVETAQKVLKLIDTLEDNDDVQEVFSNADIPDEILEKLA